MEEYENILRPRAQQHDEVCLLPRSNTHMLDPSCPIYHPVKNYLPNNCLKQRFDIFWEWYKSITDASIYTYYNINEFSNLLINERELDNEEDLDENDL